MERFDIAIVGSGPAGLSAAVNARIRNKNMIVFGNKDLSSKLVKAPKINNYLGFHDISGVELKDNIQKHIDSMSIDITCERINAVYAMGDYFTLMANERAYEAKSVILATGMEYAKPIKGEEQFLGKGVGYCATCDAPLYRNKIVTIMGYNKEAEEEANYVSEMASEVFFIPMFKGEHELSDKIQVVNDIPVEIYGDEYVSKVILKNGEISTDGVFILKDSMSPAQLVPGLEIENEHIKVNRRMETNIKGCFAAGDCTGKPYQYMKAAGEGQVAALSVVSYLDSVIK